MKHNLTLIVLLFPVLSFAQFRLDAGVAISKSYGDNVPYSRAGMMIAPAISIGYDYGHRKKVFFSTNAGYTEHGGYFNNPFWNRKEKINYPAIWVNTVGNYKLTKGKCIGFITAGPRVNCFLEEPEYLNEKFYKYRFEVGGTIGAGVYMEGKITSGVKFEYVASYFRANTVIATAFFRLKK